MADKTTLTVRKTAPPNPLRDARGVPEAGHSIYEAYNLMDPADGDVVVEILDTDLKPIEIPAPRRAVPLVTTRARPAPATIIPVEDPTAEASGPWTVGEPAPASVPVVRRVMQNAAPAPKPKRRATVKFTSFGAANKAEQEWVIGGDTGMSLVTTDETTGRPRLVAVYLAFMVESYVTDDTSPNKVTVFGKVRWHGMPADRDEEWTRKLIKWHGGERQKEFAAALEMHFGFADPRVGMVEQFLGVPATTAESAAFYGCQCFPGDGSPSVKFMTDMRHTQAGARAAIAFYQQAQDLFALPLRRMWWKRFNPAREALYVLGERYEIDGLPPAQVRDGLSAFERASLAKDVAAAAAGPVASCGKAAWTGDPKIEDALRERSLEPVAPTTFTVYQEGE